MRWAHLLTLLRVRRSLGAKGEWRTGSGILSLGHSSR